MLLLFLLIRFQYIYIYIYFLIYLYMIFNKCIISVWLKEGGLMMGIHVNELIINAHMRISLGAYVWWPNWMRLTLLKNTYMFWTWTHHLLLSNKGQRFLKPADSNQSCLCVQKLNPILQQSTTTITQCWEKSNKSRELTWNNMNITP